MGLLSSSVSITQYQVEGKLPTPVNNSVLEGLKKNIILDIDNESEELVSGWTSFENPYKPGFELSEVSIGTHLVFSLRIDKKSIPSKILKKHYFMEITRRLSETGREFLSKNEKSEIREHVKTVLSLRIPATPNIYDIIWNYEGGQLWFFSNLKSANEEFETLFSKSFKLTLIRVFPFTMAGMLADLSEPEKERLAKLSPTAFMG
ncbi:MAG: exonuclease [Candidatus Zixiibacteriota bacterium]|nr:MAG: exonuclease [candidate division Zixibacteria bacterium]